MGINQKEKKFCLPFHSHSQHHFELDFTKRKLDFVIYFLEKLAAQIAPSSPLYLSPLSLVLVGEIAF